MFVLVDPVVEEARLFNEGALPSQVGAVHRCTLCLSRVFVCCIGEPCVRGAHV